MSAELRIILFVICLLTMAFLFRKIRKSKMRVGDSVYWIFAPVMLVLLCIFPQIVYWISDLFGFVSPVNFVLLFIIFILFIKLFTLSIVVSQMKNELDNLTQKYALWKWETENDKDEENDL